MRVFQPQCTIPEEGPAFIQQPNVRSTMDIVWSSVFIIFLCTWSILHLNVPPQIRPLPPAKNFWETCRRSYFEGWYRFRRKSVWMVLTMLAPEYIFSQALRTNWCARKVSKLITDFLDGKKEDEEVRWTMTHSYYANMGGFVVKFDQDIPAPGNDALLTQHKDETARWMKLMIDKCHQGYPSLGPFDWTVHAGHYKLARKWLQSHETDHSDRYGARVLMGDVWTLSARQLLEARKIGIIDRFPTITEAEIKDKNKNDPLVKLLVMAQVLWLTIQLIIRAATGRQSSQLEVTALAFAVCAFFTYLLLLQQPKDISTPTAIHATRSPTYEEFCDIVFYSGPSGLFSREWNALHYAISTDRTPYVNGEEPETLPTYNLAMVVFSAIHLIAWNFHYPNDTEQLLWRISALFTTVVPLIAVFLTYTALGEDTKSVTFSKIGAGFILASAVVFPIPRLYLLVEAFRSTYFLPPTTYTGTWANSIPHIG